MTDPDRGAYTPPTDAPLSFDARRPASGGGRPIPFTLILSVLALLAMVAAVFFFYRSGVRGAGDAPQPVGTPLGEITAPATAEAQPEDPAAGLEIYKGDDGASAPTFAPPPETPVARPTAPVQTAPLPAVQPNPAPPPITVVTPKPAPAAPVLKPVVTTPAPKPAPKPAATTPVTPPKATTSGSYIVQIGALSSRALADQAWSQAISAGGASGKGKSVTEVQVNGSTLYRTAVTGFTTKESATAFCSALKAAGKSCFVR